MNLGPRKLFSLLFAPLFSSVRVWEKDDETKIHLPPPPPPPPSIDAIPSTEQQEEEEEGADCVGIQGIPKNNNAAFVTKKVFEIKKGYFVGGRVGLSADLTSSSFNGG